VRDSQTGEEFAAKMVSKSNASAATIAMLAEEKRILSSMQESSYIYQFREFHETNEEYVLLMEYLPGVDLMSFIRMQL
jgi:serine/threonine protein kinase